MAVAVAAAGIGWVAAHQQELGQCKEKLGQCLDKVQALQQAIAQAEENGYKLQGAELRRLDVEKLAEKELKAVIDLSAKQEQMDDSKAANQAVVTKKITVVTKTAVENTDVSIDAKPESVVCAFYGNAERTQGEDVTEKVQELLKAGKTVTANNNDFGDPLYRTIKVLSVDIEEEQEGEHIARLSKVFDQLKHTEEEIKKLKKLSSPKSAWKQFAESAKSAMSADTDKETIMSIQQNLDVAWHSLMAQETRRREDRRDVQSELQIASQQANAADFVVRRGSDVLANYETRLEAAQLLNLPGTSADEKKLAELRKRKEHEKLRLNMWKAVFQLVNLPDEEEVYDEYLMSLKGAAIDLPENLLSLEKDNVVLDKAGLQSRVVDMWQAMKDFQLGVEKASGTEKLDKFPDAISRATELGFAQKTIKQWQDELNSLKDAVAKIEQLQDCIVIDDIEKAVAKASELKLLDHELTTNLTERLSKLRTQLPFITKLKTAIQTGGLYEYKDSMRAADVLKLGKGSDMWLPQLDGEKLIDDIARILEEDAKKLEALPEAARNKIWCCRNLKNDTSWMLLLNNYSGEQKSMITVMPPFDGLGHLRCLELKNNDICIELEANTFRGLQNLTELNLLGNNRVSGDLVSVSDLVKLRNLVLEGTQVGGHIKSVSKLRSLNQLNLAGTAVEVPAGCPYREDLGKDDNSKRDQQRSQNMDQLLKWLDNGAPPPAKSFLGLW